jgi:hypothetical protein
MAHFPLLGGSAHHQKISKEQGYKIEHYASMALDQEESGFLRAIPYISAPAHENVALEPGTAASS